MHLTEPRPCFRLCSLAGKMGVIMSIIPYSFTECYEKIQIIQQLQRSLRFTMEYPLGVINESEATIPQRVLTMHQAHCSSSWKHIHLERKSRLNHLVFHSEKGECSPIISPPSSNLSFLDLGGIEPFCTCRLRQGCNWEMEDKEAFCMIILYIYDSMSSELTFPLLLCHLLWW